MWLGANKREIDEDFSHGTSIHHLGNWKLGNWGIHFFPLWLREDGLGLDGGETQRRHNLSHAAQSYLDILGLGVEDLFHHVLAVLHDPAYREANAGALRMEWPRIPLPGWPDGDADGAADELAASAARGRELAALLDSETPVPGVTEGALRPEIAAIAVPSTTSGHNMSGDDFALTAGWGHFGSGQAVMPGQGRAVKRPYTSDEQTALAKTAPALGAENKNAPAKYRPRPRRYHLRHLPQRRRLLAQRPRRRLDLQTRRLPGPQKVAFLPGTQSPRPRPKTRRSPALHKHRPPHSPHIAGDGVREHYEAHGLAAPPSRRLLGRRCFWPRWRLATGVLTWVFWDWLRARRNRSAPRYVQCRPLNWRRRRDAFRRLAQPRGRLKSRQLQHGGNAAC